MTKEKALKHLAKNNFSMDDTQQGGVSFLGSGRDFDAAVHEIGEDEIPLAIMAGEFFYTGPGTAGTNNAIIILTDQRLIKADKKIRNVDFTSFYTEDINSSSFNTSFLSSQVKIATTSGTISVSKVKKDTGKKFNDVLHGLLKEKNKRKRTGGGAALSGMDEVKKAKELLDSDIISQEEFDAIKSKYIG